MRREKEQFVTIHYVDEDYHRKHPHFPYKQEENTWQLSFKSSNSENEKVLTEKLSHGSDMLPPSRTLKYKTYLGVFLCPEKVRLTRQKK